MGAVAIFETKIEVINGISSAPSTALYYSHCLDPGSDGRIIDIKFLDEEVLLALCHSKGMFQTPLVYRRSGRLTFTTSRPEAEFASHTL